MDAMETTTTKTTQAGQAAFVPIPDLDKMAVGHAGLYPVDEDATSKESVVVENDIPLGIKGGKTLIDCEKGIKAFVKDVLAKDKSNHLPNTETGVWVHYLTEGIARDFNKTWETPPVSLREKQTPIEKARSQGKRGLSKKQKNELLAKLTYQFYESDVNNGLMSQQEAFASMAEAAAKKKELEDAGYFLSPNKTQGVSLFDWKKVVEETCGSDDATKIYTKNKIEILIPNVIDAVYNAGTKKFSKKLVVDLLKSELFGTTLEIAVNSGIRQYGVFNADAPEEGGLENFDVRTIDDLISYYEKNVGRDGDMKELKNAYKINSVHLVKMKQSGMMKPRWVCWDLTNKTTNERQLWLMDRGGARLTIKG